MSMEEYIFDRVKLLLGEEMMGIIARKRVILFGVGGVGSWCAESLVRSGIRHLTIIDSDCVSITNINRQLMATTKTIGMVKVDALCNRLLDINPDAEVIAIQQVYNKETAPQFHLEDYDYIVDAIDSLQEKADLIRHATRCPGKFFSAMGAALKLDPTRIQVAEFWKVKGCPLAKALRHKFKQSKDFPSKKFLCVYSEELLQNKGESHHLDTSDSTCPPAQTTPANPVLSGLEWHSRKVHVNGTLCHEVAIYGFTIAGLIMRDITG